MKSHLNFYVKLFSTLLRHITASSSYYMGLLSVNTVKNYFIKEIETTRPDTYRFQLLYLNTRMPRSKFSQSPLKDSNSCWALDVMIASPNLLYQEMCHSFYAVCVHSFGCSLSLALSLISSYSPIFQHPSSPEL